MTPPDAPAPPAHGPEEHRALRAAILARRESLPRRLAQVADFALSNPDEIAFGTAATVAAAAGVQPSTLVRFAQALGYDGFSALQSVFRARLREIGADAAGEVRDSALLDGFFASALRSLQQVRGTIPGERFERAVGLLAGAETIHLIARRRTYPLASYMAYAFGRLQIRCELAGTGLGIEDETLAMARPGDVAFAASVRPYAPESLRFAASLHARGIPVVSLTDSPDAPLVRDSTIWFALPETEHAGFHSLSASMAFVMALTVGVAERRRPPDGTEGRGTADTG